MKTYGLISIKLGNDDEIKKHYLLTLTFHFFDEETPLQLHPAVAEEHWKEMPVLVWVDTLLRDLEVEGKSKCIFNILCTSPYAC